MKIRLGRWVAMGARRQWMRWEREYRQNGGASGPQALVAASVVGQVDALDQGGPLRGLSLGARLGLGHGGADHLDVQGLGALLLLGRADGLVHGVDKALLHGGRHALGRGQQDPEGAVELGKADRKSTRLNSSHLVISYAVFCLKKKIGSR